MNPQETTTRNADIWSRYFQDEWSRWMPNANSPLAQVADGTAARVAGFLSLVAAGPIAWLYASNEPQVMKMTPADETAPEGSLHFVEHMESVEEPAA